MNGLVSAMERNGRADETSHDIPYAQVSKEKMRPRACFQVLFFASPRRQRAAFITKGAEVGKAHGFYGATRLGTPIPEEFGVERLR